MGQKSQGGPPHKFNIPELEIEEEMSKIYA